MPQKIDVPQDAASLAAIADEIARAAEHVRAIATTIDVEQFEAVEIPNWTILKRALASIDSFYAGARRAVRVAREQRGDFTAAKKSKAGK